MIASIFNFLNLGTGEIIIIALIVLLLFGGKKIPELMKGIGKGVSNFKKGMNDIEEEIKKPIENNLLQLVSSYRNLEDIVAEEMVEMNLSISDIPKLIQKLEKDMHKAAKILDFERAAEIRDQLKKLREML